MIFSKRIGEKKKKVWVQSGGKRRREGRGLAIFGGVKRDGEKP